MRKFDLSIGGSDGYIQRTLKNEGSVGSDMIEKIIDTYPEINPYWLITGDGEMIRMINGENGALKEPSENYEVDHFENLLLSYLNRPRVIEAIKKIQNEG